MKIGSIVAGMLAGADSIGDLDVVGHGGMGMLFGGVRAPSTLGSFLRCLSWGNARQVEKASRRLLGRLASHVPLLPGAETLAFVDIDSTQKRVYGPAKQGAGFAPHQDSGQERAGARAQRPRGHGLHATGRAGDRRCPGPWRHGELGAGRGLVRRRGDRRRPRGRVFGDAGRARGLGLPQRRGSRRVPPRPRPVLVHRHDRFQGRSPRSPTMPGSRSATRTRSGTKTGSAGSPTRRSLRPATPRSRATPATAPPPG